MSIDSRSFSQRQNTKNAFTVPVRTDVIFHGKSVGGNGDFLFNGEKIE